MVTNALSRLAGYMPGMSGPSNQILNESSELQKLWKGRNDAFTNWYDLLKLVDKLAQKDMESYVGNDPRTTWNMAVHLLQPKPFVHTVISTDGIALPLETQEIAGVIQQYFSRVWTEIDRKDSLRGRQSWFWTLAGFLTVTGWCALPYYMGEDGEPFVDYWNPATVYPEFADDPKEGLLRLARVRTITGTQAIRNIEKSGWLMPGRKLQGKVVETILWKRMDNVILHGVCMDNSVVKPLSPVDNLVKIPAIVCATGGLPDDGAMSKESAATIGQSILATNEPVYNNYNKQQTFMQQLIRDSANPRVFIKSSSGNQQLVDPDKWYKRGAMFQGGPNDEIQIIQMPGIPVEMHTQQFNLRNQLQRGGFSDMVFGNIQQEVTMSIMSQAAESAMQLLAPFYNTIKFAISEITNEWFHAYVNNPSIRPKNWPEFSQSIFDDTRMVSTYSIKIPGDLQNRVSMAKMLNPMFRLPTREIMEMLLPEVANPDEIIHRVSAEDARQHPSFMLIRLLQEYEAAAATARRAEQEDLAQLFESLAGNLRKQATGMPSAEDKLSVKTSERSEAENILPPGIESKLGGSSNAPAPRG